ncbi:Hypothetical protein A7982_11204 [Minicystis rosea]|nr:Hypothetical protein A7982_11204 [Minicystis rosea]
MIEPPAPPPSRILDVVIALAFAAGYGAPVIALVAAGFGFVHPLLGFIAGAVSLLVASIALYRQLRREGRRPFFVMFEVLVLGVLPVWGLAYNHYLGHPTCEVSSCSASSTVFRPLAEPEVYGLFALHVLTIVAYAISRRRPAALVPIAEAWVHATLLVGMVVHALLTVHFGMWTLAVALVPPLFLPCAAPLITVILYGRQLRARLIRRGIEAATPAATVPNDSPYRTGPLQEPLAATPRIHRPTLLRAVAMAPALLGLHAVVQALWFGRPDAALAVVTGTCGHMLSSMPVTVIPRDCHYLCTVAARGHAWLVRPERLGRRGGIDIVVNRQLALANAFEDLLHERWPRFGRLARRIYDRVGLPVSRYIQRRWLADLVYLAMKPAEWLFYAALLLLDRGEPEARIDRMYR